MSNSFLVQIDTTPTFLTAMRDGKPEGCSYPTRARQLSYDVAGRLADILRADGYENAVVTDRFGQLPSVADLATTKRSLEYRVTFSKHFFAGLTPSGHPLGSREQDGATSMSQGAAIGICNRLKDLGYADASIVESSSPSLDVDEEIAKLWPVGDSAISDESIESPATGLAPVDWALLGAVSAAGSPEEIAERLGISVLDLASRMTAANQKFERVINDMQTASSESAELVSLNRREFAERKQNNRK